MNKERLQQFNQLSKEIDSLQSIVDKLNNLKDNSETSFTMNVFATSEKTGERINFSTNELIPYSIDLSSFQTLLASITESANSLLGDKVTQFENEEIK